MEKADTALPSTVSLPCAETKQTLLRFARLLIALGVKGTAIPCVMKAEWDECLAKAHRIDFYWEGG